MLLEIKLNIFNCEFLLDTEAKTSSFSGQESVKNKYHWLRTSVQIKLLKMKMVEFNGKPITK